MNRGLGSSQPRACSQRPSPSLPLHGGQCGLRRIRYCFTESPRILKTHLRFRWVHIYIHLLGRHFQEKYPERIFTLWQQCSVGFQKCNPQLSIPNRSAINVKEKHAAVRSVEFRGAQKSHKAQGPLPVGYGQPGLRQSLGEDLCQPLLQIYRCRPVMNLAIFLPKGEMDFRSAQGQPG